MVVGWLKFLDSPNDPPPPDSGGIVYINNGTLYSIDSSGNKAVLGRSIGTYSEHPSVNAGRELYFLEGNPDLFSRGSDGRIHRWASIYFGGYSNYALSLNGIDSLINLGQPTNLNLEKTGTWSISVRCKMPQGLSGGSLVAKGITNNWRYNLYNGGSQARAYVFGTLIQGTSDISDGNWHHVVLVNNGGSARIVTDGVAAASTTITGTSEADGIDVVIGARRGTDNTDYLQYWDGEIDEVIIYNIALTNTQCIQLYNNNIADAPIEMGSIISYYPLESDTTDAVGNNDGMLINGNFINLL